ncbi:hypothetical protein C0V70_15460 [Bacteriovorax stolpii]|uniref:Transposase n=2 Tax=Bacteriovorax stolpii TaxID=960 RepID=A0A2K9NVD6_BACTC|nr:hypothetical protein [Bacteriovorax stolpii]AUN99479.1 hypothetical protein C0V70_15460 [Bacteriovorax stolpii]
MNPGCPNSGCIYFQKNTFCKKDGYYLRKDDSRQIQRYKCSACSKKFSRATGTLEFGQKKRRINKTIFKILSSGVSMRRSAIILGVHRTTIDRKLVYLAQKSRRMHADLLLKIGTQKVERLQFDDLITTEHTKLKPLSISVAVDARSRVILGAFVSQIPAFGHLASLSRQKYGKRKSYHKESMMKLFEKITPVVSPYAEIKSDEHRIYKEVVREFFPNADYKQYKGEKAMIAGLGELKKNGRDPLFAINHTCAMLRANINRLFRRTWCTTKKPKRLEDHLAIYIAFHNSVLLS